MTDPLKAYLLSILAKPFTRLPAIATYDYGRLRSRVIDRQYDFQTELYVTGVGGLAQEHCHPNVDSFEVLVRGKFELTVNGRPLPGELVTTPSGREFWVARVRPNQWHGARATTPGVFLSVQRWLTGSPTSIGLDWDGAPSSEAHKQLLESELSSK
jgi:quercetin dioxygenase-like cupin family protein